MPVAWKRNLVLLAYAGGSLPAGSSHSVVFDLIPSSPESVGVSSGSIGTLFSRSSDHEKRRLEQVLHSSTLHNFDNTQYGIDISIGHPCNGGPEQRFRVIADTGSSELWILASNCTDCKHHGSRFNWRESCSARPLGARFHYAYGDGTWVDGGSLRDRVKICGIEVMDQFLVQVDRMQRTTALTCDGILGLAHASTAWNREQTFIATLFQENPSLPRQFSFYIAGQSKHDSKLVIGNPNIEQFSLDSEFVYGHSHFTAREGLWFTSVWSLGWMGTGIEVALPDHGVHGSPAMIDSGTSLIIFDFVTYDKLIGDLKWRMTNCTESKNVLKCDCPPTEDFELFPELVINIVDSNGLPVSLCMSPYEYIFLEKFDDGRPGSTCVPAFQRGDKTIFGMLFMRSFYTNFDIANHRIGFARNKMSPRPAGMCSMGVPLDGHLTWMVTMLVACGSVVFSAYVLFSSLIWCEPYRDGLTQNCYGEPMDCGGMSASTGTLVLDVDHIEKAEFRKAVMEDGGTLSSPRNMEDRSLMDGGISSAFEVAGPLSSNDPRQDDT